MLIIALCSLISNMLDNACEAMIKRADMPGDHYVYLAFSYNQGGLTYLRAADMMVSYFPPFVLQY